MKKIVLLTVMTLAMTSGYAEMVHQRGECTPQPPAERAEWKESQMEEAKCKENESDAGAKAATFLSSNIYTSHPGIFYYPIAVTPSGDEVTLMDGSVWKIRGWDRDQTRGWLATDEIILMPNTSFFSFYDYRLVNRQTGVEVEANMVLKPYLNAAYSFQITGFNDNYNYIYLSDGSVWSISPYDSSIYYDWMVGDIILIGANTGWDSNVRPNVLINATHQTYIRTNCIQ